MNTQKSPLYQRTNSILRIDRDVISSHNKQVEAEQNSFKELFGNQKQNVLEQLFKQNALSFERFVVETVSNHIDNEVDKDNKFYKIHGKSFSQDQLARAFYEQNSIVKDSKAYDNNLCVVANYGSNIPLLNLGFLGELGYNTALGKKILNRTSLMACGKSFRFVGKDADQYTEVLNQAMRNMRLEQTISDLMKQVFCYGGASLIPVVMDWNSNNYAEPLFLNNYSFKKNSLVKFNVVNRYQVAPVWWNAWDGTSPDYYDAPFFLQYGNLIHKSRFIKVTTGNLPEFLAPTQQLYGTSTLQLTYKYMLSTDVILSAIVNSVVGSSIFVYESRETSNSNANLQQFLNTRKNPTGVFKLLKEEKVYVVQMNMQHFEELFLMNLHLIATFIGDNVGGFVGNSNSGNKSTYAKEGQQDAKNWALNCHQLKVDTGYTHLRETISKWLQINCFGKIIPDIKTEDVPISYDEYQQLVEIADKEADAVGKTVQILQGVGVEPQELADLVQNQAAQSEVHLLSTELKDVKLKVNKDNIMQKDPEMKNTKNNSDKKDNKQKNIDKE